MHRIEDEFYQFNNRYLDRCPASNKTNAQDDLYAIGVVMNELHQSAGGLLGLALQVPSTSIDSHDFGCRMYDMVTRECFL